MPRVTTTTKSKRGKEIKCGRCGLEITPGMPYVHFQRYRSAKQIRCTQYKCRPRQSQLTGSDKLSTLYTIQESMDDGMQAFMANAEGIDEDTLQGFADELGTWSEEAREVGSAYQESADNMSEHFPGGSTQIEEIEEKVAACEEFAEALDQAASSVTDVTFEDEEQGDVAEAVNEIFVEAASTLTL